MSHKHNTKIRGAVKSGTGRVLPSRVQRILSGPARGCIMGGGADQDDHWQEYMELCGDDFEDDDGGWVEDNGGLVLWSGDFIQSQDKKSKKKEATFPAIGDKLAGPVVVKGREVWVGVDGKLYRRTYGLVEANVPVKDTELKAMVQGDTLDPHLFKVNEDDIPPPRVVTGCRDAVINCCSGEAYVLILRDRETGDWFGVVPKQEATGGGVDAELDDAVGEFGPRGRFIGAMHLHPAKMRLMSGVDRTCWEKTPGCYSIAPRKDTVLTVWVSAGGHVWEYGTVNEDTKGAPVEVVGVGGEEDFRKLITAPAPSTKWNGKGVTKWYGGRKVFQVATRGGVTKGAPFGTPGFNPADLHIMKNKKTGVLRVCHKPIVWGFQDARKDWREVGKSLGSVLDSLAVKFALWERSQKEGGAG